jgi:6-phospho-beta-glucosidase
VEVPCQVDDTGPHPLTPTQPAGAQLGLLQQVKAVEQVTIRAAVERNPDLALQALALHPLVDSVLVARDLLTAYRRTNPALFADPAGLPRDTSTFIDSGAHGQRGPSA